MNENHLKHNPFYVDPKTNTAQKVSELKASYQTKIKIENSPKIHTSKDAYVLLKNYYLPYIEFKEVFMLLLLNQSNRVKGVYKVSEGGISGTVVDPREIFAIALKTLSTQLILAHNHPSGNDHPSQTDIQLTRRLKEGGKLIDINILDHIILTKNRYYSMGDDGILL